MIQTFLSQFNLDTVSSVDIFVIFFTKKHNIDMNVNQRLLGNWKSDLKMQYFFFTSGIIHKYRYRYWIDSLKIIWATRIYSTTMLELKTFIINLICNSALLNLDIKYSLNVSSKRRLTSKLQLENFFSNRSGRVHNKNKLHWHTRAGGSGSCWTGSRSDRCDGSDLDPILNLT
jgi:hypothetical protein